MPRPDVSEERREQILDAAGAVFARLGFHDARMDDIVDQANLSKGGVYWYFKSKDQLAAALVERVLARSAGALRKVLEFDQPFAERMALLGQYIAADVRALNKLRGVILEFYALAARDTRVRRRVRVYIDEFIDLFATMIQQGIDRGQCKEVDPRKTATAIEAMCEGLMILWLVDTTDFNIDDMADHVTALFLDALQPKARS
ncbi:MAG TPA: TetR/AcrR family transcriptional regulator [Candidatus Binataceae bacterium]|nr:TetR/AcrR family transcriptional regulator [Candidatus Binataceae bacterium]